jgi:hypothetical protein
MCFLPFELPTFAMSQNQPENCDEYNGGSDYLSYSDEPE